MLLKALKKFSIFKKSEASGIVTELLQKQAYINFVDLNYKQANRHENQVKHMRNTGGFDLPTLNLSMVGTDLVCGVWDKCPIMVELELVTSTWNKLNGYIKKTELNEFSIALLALITGMLIIIKNCNGYENINKHENIDKLEFFMMLLCSLARLLIHIKTNKHNFNKSDFNAFDIATECYVRYDIMFFHAKSNLYENNFNTLKVIVDDWAKKMELNK